VRGTHSSVSGSGAVRKWTVSSNWKSAPAPSAGYLVWVLAATSCGEPAAALGLHVDGQLSQRVVLQDKLLASSAAMLGPGVTVGVPGRPGGSARPTPRVGGE